MSSQEQENASINYIMTQYPVNQDLMQSHFEKDPETIEFEIVDLMAGLDMVAEDPLDPNLPPGYNPNTGWFSQKPGSTLDLTYRALLLQRTL